jgi:hypothetical protein
MKYKVGDKVKVRNDLVVDKTYDSVYFVENMAYWRGRVVTISDIIDNYYYKIKEDEADKKGFRYSWTDEMFEDVPENNVGEIKARTVDVIHKRNNMDNSKEFHDAFVKMIDFAKEHLSEEEFNELIYKIYTCGIENVYITEVPVYENVEYNGCVLWKRIKSVEYKIECNQIINQNGIKQGKIK